MTPEAERRLVAALTEPDTLDPGERDALVSQHLPALVGPVVRRWPPEHHADLESAATLAILRAARKWDPERGPFSPYARTAAWHAVTREVHRLGQPVTVPDRVRKQHYRARRERRLLRQELERNPTSEELAAVLDCDPRELDAVLAGVASAGSEPLPFQADQTAPTEDDLLGALEPPEAPEDPEPAEGLPDALEALERANLTAKQRRALELRLAGPGDELMPQREIAARMGSSQPAVSELLDRALSRLQDQNRTAA